MKVALSFSVGSHDLMSVSCYLLTILCQFSGGMFSEQLFLEARMIQAFL